MRKLVIAVVTLELLALTACGHALANDRELMEAIAWTRAFKADRPEAARALAQGCAKGLTTSAYLNRDGALQLFSCIRREAEAQSYA